MAEIGQTLTLNKTHELFPRKNVVSNKVLQQIHWAFRSVPKVGERQLIKRRA